MERTATEFGPAEVLQGMRREEARHMRALATMLRDGTARIDVEGNEPPWMGRMPVTIAEQLEYAANLLDGGK